MGHSYINVPQLRINHFILLRLEIFVLETFIHLIMFLFNDYDDFNIFIQCLRRFNED